MNRSRPGLQRGFDAHLSKRSRRGSLVAANLPAERRLHSNTFDAMSGRFDALVMPRVHRGQSERHRIRTIANVLTRDGDRESVRRKRNEGIGRAVPVRRNGRRRGAAAEIRAPVCDAVGGHRVGCSDSLSRP